MTKKKGTQEPVVENQYQMETEHNEAWFKGVLKAVRPDIYVLMDILDQTKVNILVVYQMIRHLNSIAMGNKYGSVTAQIEAGKVTFVRGEESTKLNEPLIVTKD